MNNYKVIFENGKAIDAEIANPHESLEVVGFGNHLSHIRWFVVECDDKERAMEIATKVVRNIWGKHFIENT